MKSLSFRVKSYLILIILILIIFSPIRTLVMIPFFFALGGFAIAIFLVNFLEIFDIIENNSSLKYWEIRQDDDSQSRNEKVCNFLGSYLSLLYSNFLISIISIFLVYKLNNDMAFLILSGTTVVMLVRLLVYSNRKIAEEIGKGFRYAILPLGFTLFVWDFFSPLTKKDPQSIYIFIIDKIPMIFALVIALIVITSFEPIFHLLGDKIKRYYQKRNK